ncbi:hypothetical protein O1L44_29835 [Streptomyces noursei]|nr:hypothetical protein [Streptomyces noursei]
MTSGASTGSAAENSSASSAVFRDRAEVAATSADTRASGEQHTVIVPPRRRHRSRNGLALAPAPDRPGPSGRAGRPAGALP